MAPGLPSLSGVTGIPADAVAALDRVAADTAVLPAMREDMKRIGALPETLERLDDGIERMDLARLSELMERILTGIDGLNSSVETLQGAVGPLARLAGRVPGQKKP